MGPSQLSLFGAGPPVGFAGRARSGRAKVFAINDQSPGQFSFYAGSIVRSGDYIDVERLTDGGYPVTMNAAGFVDIKAKGDKTRQLVHAESYSRHLQMWTGDSGQYLNNRPPTGTLTTLDLVSGVEPPTLDVMSLFTDDNGDLLTLKAISGTPPTGMTFNGQFLIGVPTDAGSGSFQVAATDPPGDIGISQVDWTITAVAISITAGSLTESIRVKSVVGGSLVG